MYEGPVRRSGGIATPRAPVPPNPVAFDHGIYPLTLHGRALTSGPPHPVVLGQTIGTLWSNIRARPTARSPPCRPDESVSPLQVPATASSLRGGTPRRRVSGVCNRNNTSRLVRGRLRKIWRHASPRRPLATIVDARRAIRVEGIVRILLHREQL